MANNDHNEQYDSRFLILGDQEELKGYSKSILKNKILKKQSFEKLKGVWGTLGWERDGDFSFPVINSKVGNANEDIRDIITKGIVGELEDMHDDITDIKTHVLERYINLDHIDFGIDWTKISSYEEFPRLRLDLFVDEFEGAMVYYFHQERNKVMLLSDDQVLEEFIQCGKTKDYETSSRDRLSYYFEVLPPNEYDLNADGSITWSDEPRDTAFIIKIVTFRRKSCDNEKLLKDLFGAEKQRLNLKAKGVEAIYNLWGAPKNALLLYDDSEACSVVATSKDERFNMKGVFYEVDNMHQIDVTKKTLLLLHGTFSNTLNSFQGLLELKDNTSELEEIMLFNGYQQVIAFNHPTISADVFKNGEEFKIRLGDKEFEHPVDIIASSRGCILAQLLASDQDLPFKVGKCIMFSPANGVGYFKTGRLLSKGLNVLRKVSSATPAKYIFAALQLSADYFMDMPGLKQMQFDSKELNKILGLDLWDENSQYFAVVNDWGQDLYKGKKGRMRKMILDKLIVISLGLRHDWVVGEKGQINMPPNYNVKTVPMCSQHGCYFDDGMLRRREKDGAKLVDVSNFITSILKGSQRYPHQHIRK